MNYESPMIIVIMGMLQGPRKTYLSYYAVLRHPRLDWVYATIWLNSLNFVDVGNVDVELPRSLSFLNLKNNPCCRTQQGLNQMLESCLTNLKELNWEDPPADETVNWEGDADLEDDTDGMLDNKQVYLEEEDERYEKTF